MKTLYLECNMGAAGDMLSAALLELHPEPKSMINKLNALGIPGVLFERQKTEKCGIRGTHLKVTVHGTEEEALDILPLDASLFQRLNRHTDQTAAGHTRLPGGMTGEAGSALQDGYHDHDHAPAQDSHGHDHAHDHHDYDHHGHDHTYDHHDRHGHDHTHGHHAHVHRSLSDIEAIVGKLDLAEPVEKDILAVYRLIAEAESHAHGRPAEQIHFHEVGNMDAVADITAFCLLLHELSPEQVIASPVKTGFGEVRCAHGILPVPAPATAWILRDIPIYAGEIRGELCTPTGAALLKHFASGFGNLPPMAVEKIGIGCGKKDFPQANCVRAMLGETTNTSGSSDISDISDTVLELRCNLDDMTPEAVGFAMERLFEAGALDVYVTPLTMKKSRPGLLLSCMCEEVLRDRMVRQIFVHTTTLGIREYRCNRFTLRRSKETVHTPEGDVRCKKAQGYGTSRCKYEYDDLSALARKKNISLMQAADYADGFR